MTKIRLREYSDRRFNENMATGCLGFAVLGLVCALGVLAYREPVSFVLGLLGIVAFGYFCYLMGRISFE